MIPYWRLSGYYFFYFAFVGAFSPYFGLYLLAMGRGRPRSATALAAMLREAGFVSVQVRPTRLPLQTGLLIARKGR
mgnify:CR=1 FL=1